MGLFTYVEIAKELLPEKYWELKDWQTKGVIEPSMDLLKITPDGYLYHYWNSYTFDEDDTQEPKTESSLVTWFGKWKVIAKHADKLEFHGDLHAYSSYEREDDKSIWVDLYARFTEGKLVTIQIEEKDLA